MKRQTLTLHLQNWQRESFSRMEDPAGIHFFRLNEVHDTDETRHRLYRLVREGVLDEPGHDGPFESFSDFCEKLFYRYYWQHRHTQFIARCNEEWVGLSSVRIISPETAECGLTVVKNSFRGMGIATSLKLRAISHCRDQGVKMMCTHVNEANQPMLSINFKLGFRITDGEK
jgi:GNAT superfamily N-acetyltransferase